MKPSHRQLVFEIPAENRENPVIFRFFNRDKRTTASFGIRKDGTIDRFYIRIGWGQDLFFDEINNKADSLIEDVKEKFDIEPIYDSGVVFN